MRLATIRFAQAVIPAFLLTVFFPCSLPAQSSPPTVTGTVVLTWDPPPPGQTWEKVRIYERLGTAPNYTYVRVAEVDGKETKATIERVPAGEHYYVARSFDIWESENSNVARVGPQPVPPVLSVVVEVRVASTVSTR